MFGIGKGAIIWGRFLQFSPTRNSRAANFDLPSRWRSVVFAALAVYCVSGTRGALGSYNLEFVGQNALYKVRRTK